MSDTTKSCALTEKEIEVLINHYGFSSGDYDDRIERMSYLNKRRKAFSEPEITKVGQNASTTAVQENSW